MTATTPTPANTTETIKPKATWSDVIDGNKMLHDVLAIPAGESQIATELLIQSSFFLPQEILSNKDYKISPIYCLTAADFTRVFLHATMQEELGNLKMHCDCAWALLAYARYIGVSARKNLATGKIVLVIKIWYGHKPFIGEGNNTVYTRKLQELHKFISTAPIPV